MYDKNFAIFLVVKKVDFKRITFCIHSILKLGLPRKFVPTGNGGTTASTHQAWTVSLMLFSKSKPISRDFAFDYLPSLIAYLF